MIDGELKLPATERIDFAAVATPNHTHFEIAKALAEAGFNVMCDKPLTFDLAQAEELAKVVDKTGVVFAVTHNYTGYPLVRQARDMVLGGELGEINAVRAFYIQGWLRTRLEKDAQKQAAWRTDPKQSGAAGCFGDIATHAYNLGRYVTGLLPDQISCTLKVFEQGRALDDYGAALIKYQNGALGTVTASQISPRPRKRPLGRSGRHQGRPGMAPGRAEQDVAARQRQAAPDLHARRRSLSGRDGRSEHAHSSGHPEAFLEAFANIYTAAYDAMIQRASGKKVEMVNTLYPNVADGVDGMNFITQCVASSAEGGAWRSLKHPLCRK